MKRTLWFFLLLTFIISSFTVADTPAELEKKLRIISGRERLPLLRQLASKQWLFTGDRYLTIGREIKAIARASGEKREEAFALRTMALGHTNLGQHEKALALYFESLLMEEKTRNTEGAAESNSEIGNLLYFCFGNYPKAIEYYGKALEQYRRLKNPYGIAKHLNNQAEVFRLTGEYEKATNFYLEALQQCENNPQTMSRAKAVILSNLCAVNIKLGNREAARRYLDEANTIKNSGQNFNQLQLDGLIGDLLQLEGKLKEALAHFNKALIMINAAPGSHSHLAQSRLIADVLQSMGKVHLLMGNPFLALQHLKKAVALTKEVQDYYGMAKAQLHLARAYWQAGDSNTALLTARKNETLCQKYNFFIELGELYHDLCDWFLKMGDSQKAIFYRQREEEVKKSIHEPRMAAAVLTILMKYEYEKQGMQVASFRQQRILIFLISFLTITIIIVASILHSRNVRHRSKVDFLATERELRGEHQSQLDSLKTRLQEIANQDAPKKYKKSSLSRQEAHYFLKQLIETMERGKPYLESDLTIDKLAKTLNINRSYLSQVINECGEKSFHDFINGFRVEEAKRLLLKTSATDCSSLQIGFKVGFSSKSTFYFAFKKIAGLTPNEFRKQFSQS